MASPHAPRQRPARPRRRTAAGAVPLRLRVLRRHDAGTARRSNASRSPASGSARAWTSRSPTRAWHSTSSASRATLALDRIEAATLATVAIDRVVEPGGLVCVTWRARRSDGTDELVDSYLRPQDASARAVTDAIAATLPAAPTPDSATASTTGTDA
ncbi:MAG: hypothetical protein R2723_04530 [Microbacterium sp.]